MFLVPDGVHLTTTANAALRLTLTAAVAAQSRGAGVEFEFLVLPFSFLCFFTLMFFVFSVLGFYTYNIILTYFTYGDIGFIVKQNLVIYT